MGSRAKARQAIRSGKVEVEGAPVTDDDAGASLAVGAHVTLAWTRPGTNPRRTAGREGLQRVGVVVRFEDAAVLVADKPAGLLTDAADAHQVRHHDTLRKRVTAYAGGEVWPVHRIDRDTTGLVLFAKTEDAREALKAQWGERTPVRAYLALLQGELEGDSGRWSDWMRWDGRRKLQRPAERGQDRAVLAQADWQVVRRLHGATLVEVRLVTGRRNQIRLHAELRGHPMVGDRLYHGQAGGSVRFPRQALHAARLGVRHPTTGAPVQWESPLPDDLRALIRRLARSPG